MGYITEEYYTGTFKGTHTENLARMIEAASDTIDMIVTKPIETVTENVMKATAYQVECLNEQGGLSAMHGFSASSEGVSESLGDYSYSGGSSSGQGGSGFTVVNGIPISPLAISLLRKDGLMSRWLYAGRYKDAK